MYLLFPFCVNVPSSAMIETHSILGSLTQWTQPIIYVYIFSFFFLMQLLFLFYYALVLVFEATSLVSKQSGWTWVFAIFQSHLLL